MKWKLSWKCFTVQNGRLAESYNANPVAYWTIGTAQGLDGTPPDRLTESVAAVGTHVVSAQGDVQNADSESVICIIETVAGRQDMAVGDESAPTSKLVAASFILKDEVNHPRELIGRRLSSSSDPPGRSEFGSSTFKRRCNGASLMAECIISN
jgi:hypothetical protein